MSGYILRENDPSIVLTADQADRLVWAVSQVLRENVEL